MVRFVRTATPAAGKMGEAVQWGAELTAYINTVLDGELIFFIERYGEHRVHWAADFSDVAMMDADLKKLEADDGYRQRVSGAGDIFLGGHLHDTVVETI